MRKKAIEQMKEASRKDKKKWTKEKVAEFLEKDFPKEFYAIMDRLNDLPMGWIMPSLLAFHWGQIMRCICTMNQKGAIDTMDRIINIIKELKEQVQKDSEWDETVKKASQ